MIEATLGGSPWVGALESKFRILCAFRCQSFADKTVVLLDNFWISLISVAPRWRTAMAATKIKFESFDEMVKSDALRALAKYPGPEDGLLLTGKLAAMARQFLKVGVEAGGLAFGPVAAELSPEDAGKILGVSRPLVVQRMDDGRLPFRYVGSHRRCSLSDVLKLREVEEPVNEALSQLYEEHEKIENAPRG